MDEIQEVKLIIDTDPGIDDAMAIHLAFALERLTKGKFQILGLTTIFGNVTTQIATRNALALKDMAHHDAIIAEGEKQPFHQPAFPPADFVHGREGFGEHPAIQPISQADKRTAAEYLVEMAKKYKGELVICAIGPLTNLVAALNLDKDFAQNVKEIVIMGGAFHHKGNVSAFAEANIWNDCPSAEQVMATDWPIKMIGLDVTMKIIASQQEFNDLADKSPKIGGFLKSATDFYFTFHETQHDLKGCYMHDPATILAISHPHLFTYEEHRLQVICEGEEMGRTAPSDDSSRRKVKIALGVDAAQAKRLFFDILANYS